MIEAIPMPTCIFSMRYCTLAIQVVCDTCGLSTILYEVSRIFLAGTHLAEPQACRSIRLSLCHARFEVVRVSPELLRAPNHPPTSCSSSLCPPLFLWREKLAKIQTKDQRSRMDVLSIENQHAHSDYRMNSRIIPPSSAAFSKPAAHLLRPTTSSSITWAQFGV